MASSDLSVILCVRNGERFITQALDSVVAQDIPRIEVVIVDDGSTDGTVAAVADHRLSSIVVRQEPAGPAAAVNAGVRRASGALVCFLDHDDVWPDGRLGTMVRALRDEPGLDAIFGTVVNTDWRLRPIAPPIPARLLTAMLIRRNALDRVGPFRTDVSHAANVDWISRAEATGLQSRFLDRVVLWRRIHGDNTGVRDRGTARLDMLRVIRDHHHRGRSS